MAGLRQMPVRYMVLISLIGSVGAKLLLPQSTLSKFSSLTLIFGILTIQITIFTIYSVFIYPFFFSPFRHLPSPSGGLPLLGHGRDLRIHGPGKLAQKWFTEIKGDGPFRVLWHGNQELIVFRSTPALAEILVKNSYKFEKPDFARELLAFVIGWALLTTEGDEHKSQRRNMLPAFSFRHIKDLYPLFWEKAKQVALGMTEECRQKVANKNGQVDMEVSSWSVRGGLDIIGLAGMGIDFGAIKDANSELAQSYYTLNPSPSDFVVLGLLAFLPAPLVQSLPLPRIRTVRKAATHIRGVCRDLIRDKKRMVANKEDIGVDILSVALQTGLFTDENLVDQMMTFLSAGHETTAAALVWTLYLLCKYPHVQDRLRREIRDNLPSLDDPTAAIDSNAIDGLPYLNGVCNESLRVFSPVPATIRVANCDTVVDGQFIPRDTLLMLPIWAINKSSLLWGDDAVEFKPERWMTPEQGGISEKNAGNGGATSNYAFMTFLHGPHSCIGGNFSKSEMACLLAAWVGRFSFEIDDKSLLDERNLQIHASVVAKPEGGMPMKVKIVEGW